MPIQRVVFGVSSSPFLLNAMINHHLKQCASTNPELVDLLLRSIYVDDVIMGASDMEMALKLYEGSKRILKEGGFNLRMFATNALQLQKAVDAAEQSPRNPASTSLTHLEESNKSYAKSTLGGA